ncbi:hypothetical protein SUTMEG_17570 [Sutterella megalosphaeroides]|uniref:Uncharacterized protein n=1 Tax=Sutterella megalosphaeroides TaxID=2494234 RepID=A0A2Z6IGJ4_9BURK|nr:hypothetical protein SUTMEG_17570 [Sutterella megalosphaeroides]
MKTATVSKFEYFRRGLLDGLTAPFRMFTPKPTAPKFDESLLESSYVGNEADAENIRSDFEKVLGHARTEPKLSARKPR